MGHRPPAAAGHLRQLRDHPRRPRGVGQRPLRRPRPAEERLHLRRRRAAHVPGHRHRHRDGQAGPARPHRRRRRGRAGPRHPGDLRRRQPALLADGAAHDVGREEHRHEPAGPDRAVRDRRRRLLVPLHGQGGRLGQQELPVPGDQGTAQPRAADGVPRREDAHARHRRLPAVPPRRRHRRHVRRVRAEDGQVRVGPLPRLAPDLGQRPRPRVPRPRARGAGARDDADHRHRRPVRRQVLLPRRPGGPAPPPRRLVPGRDRGQLLGRPAGQGEDHRRRRLPRGARAQPGAVPARRHRRGAARRERREVVRIDLNRPMAEIRAELSKHPVRTRARADRPDGGGPRHRPRQDQGSPRRRRADAGLPARPLRLLRGSGQDAGRLRLGLVRSDHRRPHGRLRRPVPGGGRQPRDAGQGQPVEAGDRRLPAPRRLLPRLDRRPRGPAGPGLHHQGRGARVPRARDGGGVEDRGAATSRPSSSSTTRARTSSPTSRRPVALGAKR